MILLYANRQFCSLLSCKPGIANGHSEITGSDLFGLCCFGHLPGSPQALNPDVEYHSGISPGEKNNAIFTSVADERCKPCLFAVRNTAETACHMSRQLVMASLSYVLVTPNWEVQEHAGTFLCIQSSGSLCAAKRTAEQRSLGQLRTAVQSSLETSASSMSSHHSLHDLLRSCGWFPAGNTIHTILPLFKNRPWPN